MTDNLTGFMWARSANRFGTARSWNNALTDCNDLTLGGHDDWRLPNRFELEGLLDLSQYNPTLPSGHPFTGVQSGDYWSSTTYVGNTTRAWFVSLGYGYVGFDIKTYATYVWPVRGGQ